MKARARNAWMTTGDPGVAEIVSSSNAVDAVTIDLQHGTVDLDRLPDLARAIELGGATPMARLAGPDAAQVGRVLDTGFTGLIMPGVASREEAADFVSWAHHPPRGSRSHGPIRSAAKEGETQLWAMIESAEGLADVAGIAKVDGIDGLFIGPGDLGLSLGIGGGQNRTEPEFLDAVTTIRSAADSAGCLLGIHSSRIDYSLEMLDSGFDLVTVWVDAVSITSSLRAVEQAFGRR